ncbi:MAG: dTMP kinase [Nannocystaceae bacterium]
MSASGAGLFIALEGIDGSGTSTQTRALASRLRERGLPVHETCEPSRGPIGRMIREHLSAARTPIDPGALALLFAADRLDHVAREIRPAIDAGAIVISDRYVVSSLVYQSTECDPAWVRSINARAPWPDLCVLLDLDPEIAIARVRARIAQEGGELERYDHADVQRRLAAGYRDALAARELGPIIAVDAAAPVDAVTTALLDLLERHATDLAAPRSRPLP